MSVNTTTKIRTIADLVKRLGNVPLDRIRFDPTPGKATVQDVIEIAVRENIPCELVHGILVKKPMGLAESVLASFLIAGLNVFVHPRNLGLVTGEQGTFQIMPDLVRMPDVAFTSWDRMSGRRRPDAPAPPLVPDLAVEILSSSNTPEEMKLKRTEYFTAGVRLVWEVDPEKRTVTVYYALTQSVTLTETDTLDGGPVLPGFTVSLQEFFAELDRHG